MAGGPDNQIFSHNGWCINGFRFRTIQSENHLKTQNSGIVVQGDEEVENTQYHGQLTHIIVLQYLGRRYITLFKCEWFEVSSQNRGYREDRYGFISLNCDRRLKTNEPYILACQAGQVYFIKDVKNPSWHIVVKVSPRHVYDVPEEVSEEDIDGVNNEPYQGNEVRVATTLSTSNSKDVDELAPLTRYDIDGERLDATLFGEVEEQGPYNNVEEDLLTEDEVDSDNDDNLEELIEDDD